MDNLNYFKCYICFSQLVDFTMLSCNHTICHECLSLCSQGALDVITVPCSCGVVTSIFKQKNQDISSLFTKTVGSKASTYKNRPQVLSQSMLNIFSHSESQASSKITSKIYNHQMHKFELRQMKSNNIINYLQTELINQLKFIQQRFKRYLNQINRFYTQIVQQLNKQYSEFKCSLLQKCKAKIQKNEIKCLSTIQSTIQRDFKPRLQNRLIKLSQQLSKFLQNPNFHFPQMRNKQNVRPNLNINLRYSRKKSKSKKKMSRHQSCKLLVTHPDEIFAKPAYNRDSKIRKKQIKRVNQCQHI